MQRGIYGVEGSECPIPHLLPHVRSPLRDVVEDVELPIASCSPSKSLLCIQLFMPAGMSPWKCFPARDSCDIAEPSSAAGLLLMQKGALKNSSLLSSYVFLTGSF